jgi:hypothetical protein
MYLESQSFRQVWYIIVPAILICLGFLAVVGYGMYKQLYLGESFGSKPLSNGGLKATFVISSIVLTGVMIMLFITQMEVEVSGAGVRYRFVPFLNTFKSISVEEIKSYEVGKYSPMAEFGGWGIRFGIKKKVFSISGNQALKITLQDGKKVYFGTKKPEEMEEAMRKYIKNRNP